MKVYIIGAGASGLMAAISAAGNNNEVVVLELKEEAGKKIYATGNGRCNLTNEYMDIECYRSDDLDKVKHIISNYNTQYLTEYFKELGLYTTNIDNYIYPVTKQATTVVKLLVDKCLSLGVSFVYNCNVKSIDKVLDSNSFKISAIVNSSNGSKRVEYDCDKVIVACGGKAASKLGSDGSGYYLIGKLSHSINTVVPALVPLICDDSKNGKILKLMQKQRINAQISVYYRSDDTKQLNALLPEDVSKGELQLTEYGVSGIVVFQVSGKIAKALVEGKRVDIKVDLCPEYEENDLKNNLTNIYKLYGKHNETSYKKVLSYIINEKVAEAMIEAVFEDNTLLNISTEEILSKIASTLKNYTLRVIGTKDFEQAQVCSGGVSLKEVDEHMESKKVKGLYIVGELLDVDGICGGYNLHFAFVSGIIAGNSILEECYVKN